MITAILIGAGARGIGVYGEYGLKHPEAIRFVAVAEPDLERRAYFSYQHQIPIDKQYPTDQEILASPKMADTCFICTQDTLHVAPALKAMELGYDIFLEKPMAVTPEDCLLLGEKAKQWNRKMMIGHVLRYTPFFSQIKAWLDDGKIGKLMTIQHNENVSYWHHAHSYVRGNWHNEKKSAPMLLAKSCHDLDLMIWLSNSKIKQVSSLGKLTHYKESNAPKGSPPFCMDGCPVKDTCLFYAPKVYLKAPIWMKLPVSNQMTDESLLAALKNGPYGRCVYHNDNDVVDHQVTIIEFENEVTVAFTMTAFTEENTRTIKLMGTLGEIRGHLEKSELELIQFGKGVIETKHCDPGETGHGGGDQGIMEAFIGFIETDANRDKADLDASIASHLLAFAAEESRKRKTMVDYANYIDKMTAPIAFHPCREEEYHGAIRLASETFKEAMDREYPLLLGKANQERMFVATKDEEVLSLVSYYPASLHLGDAYLQVGSIGSVCTRKDYQGRRLASALLKMAEAKMLSEQISLAIISGEGSLYERFGATRVGHVKGYMMDPSVMKKTDAVIIRDYQEQDLPTIFQLSESEPFRYERTLESMQRLIKGTLIPRMMVDHALEIIEKQGKISAYVVLRLERESEECLIHEFAGNRQSIVAAFPLLLEKHHKSLLLLPARYQDSIHDNLKYIPASMTDQYASFKVVNWPLFIKEIWPLVKKQCPALQSWTVAETTFPTIMLNNMAWAMQDIHQLHRLVFGPKGEAKACPNPDLQRLLEEAFPIDFVWTNNLNYQ
ncbi:MAG: GNAT family N-acetyltransferase [Candidatus Izemoplasmatales bacterium]|nr:GNAT family N-acetyltransferase [Candidatus Izemoplasmatales bacterium]